VTTAGRATRETGPLATSQPHPWPALEAIASQSVSAGDRWPSLPKELEVRDPEPTTLLRERERWARLEREQREC
jgi:hypothetical protein